MHKESPGRTRRKRLHEEHKGSNTKNTCDYRQLVYLNNFVLPLSGLRVRFLRVRPGESFIFNHHTYDIDS